MLVTLNKLSACRVLRALRAGASTPARRPRPCGLEPPSPAPYGGWTRKRLAGCLERYADVAVPSRERPLDVAVATEGERLRVVGTRSTIYSRPLPANSFVDLGDGVRISSPELLFVEMARLMGPAVHLLFGMELCGRFARSATDPRGGAVAYGVEPATSIERLRRFVREAKGLYGLSAARRTLELLVDEAWSPMEAVIATLLCLPAAELGYDLGPIRLNRRLPTPRDLAGLTEATSRVPDILFSGTRVGINYDGEGHLGIRDVADAALRLGMDPGSAKAQDALDAALRHARDQAIADRHRDRDLALQGLCVIPVTSEDLYREGGLDLIVEQALAAIERTSGRDLSDRRASLRNPTLARLRQDLIRSLLPGAGAVAAHMRHERAMAPSVISVTDAVVGPDGTLTIL